MTNEEISNLTDEQINVMVTRCAHGAHDYKLNVPGANLYKLHHTAIGGVSVITVKDYCNDPAVMWPIMVNSCISTFIENGAIKHMACVSSWANCAFDVRLETYDENPLRAAAIVYLKIKGVL